jgi:hypothetical protein
MTVKRIRGLLALVAAAVVFAGVIASAEATTSPTNYTIFNVRLTDSGVAFSPKAQLQIGEVGLFRVTNLSKSGRVFAVSSRATHLLKTKGKESFYEIFDGLGKVRWTSHSAKGKSFAGFVRVVPCHNSSGTTLCNGTGD